MKFKVGQKVSLDKEGGATGTIRFVDEEDEQYMVQRDDGVEGGGERYEKKQTWVCYDYNVTILDKSLETLVIGDIVTNGDIDKDVLAVLGGGGKTRSYLMSMEYLGDDDNDKFRADCPYTAFELAEDRYSVKETEGVVEEMTMEELCKELGRNVKIKK